MGRNPPPEAVFQLPYTPEGRRALARRVAEVRAEAVLCLAEGLDCPDGQKRALLLRTAEAADTPERSGC